MTSVEATSVTGGEKNRIPEQQPEPERLRQLDLSRKRATLARYPKFADTGRIIQTYRISLKATTAKALRLRYPRYPQALRTYGSEFVESLPSVIASYRDQSW